MENEILDAPIADDAPVEIETVIIENPEPAPTPTVNVEVNETISQLVATLAVINDQLQALRLEIQAERSGYLDRVTAELEQIRAEIQALVKVEAAEVEAEHEEHGVNPVEEVIESVKPRSRWM